MNPGLLVNTKESRDVELKSTSRKAARSSVMAQRAGHFATSALVFAGLAGTMFSAFSTFPHSIAYFNEISGGPYKGGNHLLHSNIDWGQDLLLLQEWLNKQGWAHTRLCSSMTSDMNWPYAYISALRDDCAESLDWLLLVNVTKYDTYRMTRGAEEWEAYRPTPSMVLLRPRADKSPLKPKEPE